MDIVYVYIYIYNVYNMYGCGVSSRFFGGPHSPVPDLQPARSKPSLPRTFWMKNVQKSLYVMEGIYETSESFTSTWFWLVFQFNVHFGSIKYFNVKAHTLTDAIRPYEVNPRSARWAEVDRGSLGESLIWTLFTSLHCQDNNPDIRTCTRVFQDMELKVTWKIICQ